jgi:formamidopyrimidine-DNA glycosylase
VIFAMPELPEVEYIARQLQSALIGRTITRAEVRWPRAITTPDPVEFAACLTVRAGRRIARIGRRGKYLLLGLDGDETLIAHRRMSGNLTLLAPGAEAAYTRVTFTLDDGRTLAFSDPRKFGRLALVAEVDLPAFFAALGPEPLEPDFTPARLAARLAGRARALKALLLDQSVVVGLGNIYADEALYAARLHPLRAGNSLTAAEIAALHGAIQSVLRAGIAHGGTTFGRHRDIYDEAGTNLDYLQVYRRTGAPCHRCGTPITRIVVTQRGTHFCPHCQTLPPAAAASP